VAIPSGSAIWKKYEQLYLEIFSTALINLSVKDSLPGKEDAISEKMYPVLNRICWGKNVATPSWKLPIAPLTEEELTGGKKNPYPDFTCKFRNDRDGLVEEFEIPLHVECKLLGKRTSRTWILNKEYVINGIKRFDSNKHGYGKRALSGIMIGYIISMTPEEINIEVNNFQSKHLPANAPITFDFNQAIPFQTRQGIKRQNVIPDQFEIIHLWIDLRKSYQPSATIIE